MTFFAIARPFLDQSFWSSNSTEILMRQFCVQNFMTIGWAFQELSCKRPDGRTHWPILECTHFLSTQKLLGVVIKEIFFPRFEVCSLQVLYLDKCKLVSYEPLDYDRVWHALQKCLRDPSSISYGKPGKKTFFSKDNFFSVFRCSVVIRAEIWLSVGIKETTPNNDNWRSWS